MTFAIALVIASAVLFGVRVLWMAMLEHRAEFERRDQELE